jgi:hypothetical protein
MPGNDDIHLDCRGVAKIAYAEVDCLKATPGGMT